MRAGGTGNNGVIWLPHGEYEVVRDLGDKYLIVVTDLGWLLRTLTCVKHSECRPV
jgi:hypothetical protein